MLDRNSANVYTRRLPIYILVDCSESMSGAPLQAMQMGISFLHNELLNTPQALETCVLNVIGFARDAWRLVRQAPLLEFTPPYLYTDSHECTALGAALWLVNNAIDNEGNHSTKQIKGDYCPIVFAFIDGMPTDDWVTPAKRLIDEKEGTGASLIIFLCGIIPSSIQLQAALPEAKIIRLQNAHPDFIASCFVWRSQPVKE